MKKLFALLMTVAMMVSFCAVFAVSSAAAVTSVEPTYNYADAAEEFGQETAVFCDGLWMYEYRKAVEDGSFAQMEYYCSTLPDGSVAMGSQNKFYTPFENVLYDSDNPGHYCLFRAGGKQIHPGSGYDAVLTFVVPASGTVAYEMSIHMTGAGETGDDISVYLNETMVWPSTGEAYNMLPGTEPSEIKIDTLSVKAGDKIRFVLGSRGAKGGKATQLDTYPLVTYLQADVPIRNFFAPDPINTSTTANTCVVSWAPADKAVAYNVYMGETKLNSEPITGTEFTITGLEPSKSYLGLTVTSVNAQGQESEPSTAMGFRTKKGETTNTDTKPPVTTTDTSENPTSGNAPATTDTNEPTNPTNNSNNTEKQTPTTTNKTVEKKSTNLTWLWICLAILAVAVIAVVVVLVLKKKKKSAE